MKMMASDRNDRSNEALTATPAVFGHGFGQNLCHLSATRGANPCHQSNKKEARKPLSWANMEWYEL
jgi:hypothetical protein